MIGCIERIIHLKRNRQIKLQFSLLYQSFEKIKTNKQQTKTNKTWVQTIQFMTNHLLLMMV